MFLAIHIGAGFHSPSKLKAYKKLIKESLLIGKGLLINKTCGIQVISKVIKILEDSGLTNAGYGSNLNLIGEVELDASLMEGKTKLFSSVGAMKSIRNPIELCEKMIVEYSKGHWNLGRIPPIMLSGDYNKLLSKIYNLPKLNDNKELISESSLNQYKKYIQKFKGIGENSEILELIDSSGNSNCDNELNNTKESNEEAKIKESLSSSFYDTVGAICIDHNGNIISGCSSGGISLKLPGRIGEASIKKLGCFADNCGEDNDFIGVGYSCTGMGEHLTTINLGDKITQNFKNFIKFSENDNDEEFNSKYFTPIDYLNIELDKVKDNVSLTQFDLKLMGILFLGVDKNNDDIHLLKCFSTPSMGSGYWNPKKDEIKVSVDYKEDLIKGSCKNDDKWCLIGNKFKL